MLVEQVVRLKLGGGNTTKAKEFMQELNSITDEHPFDRSKRIVGGAAVEVSVVNHANDRVYLHDIMALDPRKGYSSQALGLLTRLADKHHVTIELFAMAYTRDTRYLTVTEKLVRWYQKLGFVVKNPKQLKHFEDGVEMEYLPK
jgi:hypothetical protein